MINTLIFDLDGLMIDSEPFWRKAEIEIFSNEGIYLTEDMCRQVMGLRIDEVVRYWFRAFNKETVQAEVIQKRIVDRVCLYIEQEGKPLPGITELVQAAYEMQFGMAIASSSELRLIETAVKQMQFEKYFTVLHSAQFEKYGKPHPDIFIHTAEKLGVLPENCLVLEDSVNGVIAAKAARMQVVAIPEAHMQTDARFGIADFRFASAKDVDRNFLQKIKQNHQLTQQ